MFAQSLRSGRNVLGGLALATRRCLSDEVTSAQFAARTRVRGAGTLFDKIIAKEIPAKVIYEDERCLAFEDIAPQAPVHFLVIPKTDVVDMVENAGEKHEKTLGHLLATAGRLGKERAPNGFRVVVNNGPDGCQSVYHLHLHVLGGRQLNWPPG